MSTQKTISGTITDIAFKSGQNGEYVEVALMQSGMEYPTKCRGFDETLVQRFRQAKKGMGVGLIIEEAPGTFQGKPITYRNIKGIVQAAGDAPDTPRAQRAAAAESPSGVDRQDLIMLQHASGVVAQAYGDWLRIDKATGTFGEYLKAIAEGATWYLHNVYQQGGYDWDAPERPQEAPEGPSGPEVQTWTSEDVIVIGDSDEKFGEPF